MAQTIGSGKLDMYVIRQGFMFYSEEVKEDGEAFIFVASKTATITLKGVNAQGTNVWDVGKASKQMGFPTRFRMPKTSVAFTQDVTDKELMKEIRRELSGLIII